MTHILLKPMYRAQISFCVHQLGDQIQTKRASGTFHPLPPNKTTGKGLINTYFHVNAYVPATTSISQRAVLIVNRSTGLKQVAQFGNWSSYSLD